jgi:hypothetical protein
MFDSFLSNSFIGDEDDKRESLKLRDSNEISIYENKNIN